MTICLWFPLYSMLVCCCSLCLALYPEFYPCGWYYFHEKLLFFFHSCALEFSIFSFFESIYYFSFFSLLPSLPPTHSFPFSLFSLVLMSSTKLMVLCQYRPQDYSSKKSSVGNLWSCVCKLNICFVGSPIQSWMWTPKYSCLWQGKVARGFSRLSKFMAGFNDWSVWW